MSFACGLGLVAQSIFVGGNIAISSIAVPVICEKSVSNTTRVRQFGTLFDRSAIIMSPCAIISGFCNAWLLFYGPQAHATTFLIGTLASFSPLPVTRLLVLPQVKRIKSMIGDERASANSISSIRKWNSLSVARLILYSAGYISTILYVVSSP